MNHIQEKDIVRLKRNVDHELQQGLVGTVLQCHSDKLEIHFPLQGKNIHAQLPLQDIEFVTRSEMLLR
jgi:hypothetical protein